MQTSLISSTEEVLTELLAQRILVLDGAMGTTIQGFGLNEEDFRGSRFATHPKPLKGCNDLLVLTQPQIIENIHRQYLEAGSDIIETNTFNATRIGLAEYALGDYVFEINKAAAEVARRAAEGTQINESVTRVLCVDAWRSRRILCVCAKRHSLTNSGGHQEYPTTGKSCSSDFLAAVKR